MTYASDAEIKAAHYPDATSFPNDNTVPTAMHALNMSRIDNFINSIIRNNSGSNVTDKNGMLANLAIELYGQLLERQPLSIPKQLRGQLVDIFGTIPLVTANPSEHATNRDGA